MTAKAAFFLLLLCSLYFSLFTDASALDIKRTVITNGLTVLHVERPNLPIVIVTLLIKASPVNEPAAKSGLANLTAELLTEGTEKRKAAEISEEIEFIGAGLNASVDSDLTTISLFVLKKDVEKGFDIFSDVILNPAFVPEELERNRELIKGGLKQNEEDPHFVVSKAFKKAVFGEQPYGRLVRGSVEGLDNIKRADILKFHSDYYRPNNSILSVVGDLTEKELTSLINRFFSEWKPADIPKIPIVQKADKTKKTVLIEKNITQANIMIGHEGLRREDPDYYAVLVMNYILGGGGFSSRLMQTVRDDMGLAYDIHSYFIPNKSGGIFEVGVQTKNESAKAVITEVLKQIRRISSEPVTDKELEDAKAYLTGSFPRKLDTNKKIAGFMASMEFFNLGVDYIEKYPKYINSVTKEDLLRVAKKYLDPERYVLVVVARQGETKLETGEEKNEKK